MTEEELEISRSTPHHRFDLPATPAPVVRKRESAPRDVEGAPPALDPEAERFVREVVSGEPVVMFALEWCEFCWSVRKLFSKLGIEYRSIDLDSVEYQTDDRGGKIRAVLARQTGAPTIPQIFIGGEHVGGCTDLFDEHAEGRLQRRLDTLGIDHLRSVKIDAYDLLPGWLHPRQAS